ncbi:MAG: glycosyltransferase family 39 protein [Proteobacteria bacterium]|nr:glycosyltransferase family 39 protein [Pseudomonadota bacterium]MBU1594597.1 glycosyltransferase family 39 protein [Pseudomonadota bacterium]
MLHCTDNAPPAGPAHDLDWSKTLLLLCILLAGGAYARFAGLSLVGLSTGDDFLYWKWAFDWYNGDFTIYGLFRIANPLIGALGIKIFGVNDYALHFTNASFGLLNIVLVFLFASQVSGSRTQALCAAFVQALSRRVVEIDRFETPHTYSETFILLTAILLLAYLKHQDGQQSMTSRGMALLVLSGLCFGFGALTHFDLSFCGPSIVGFLLLVALCAHRSWKRALQEMLVFTAGYFVPLAAGIAYFSYTTMFGALFGMRELQHLNHLPTLANQNWLYYTYVRAVGGSIGADLVPVLFLLLVPYAAWSVAGSARRGEIDRSALLSLLSPLMLLAYVGVLSFVRVPIFNRHSLFLLPFVAVFVIFWTWRVLASLGRSRHARRWRLGGVVVLALVFLVQFKPQECFSAKWQKPSAYRQMHDVLKGRINHNERLLITPYVVRDFRFQSLTLPAYFTKRDVDHVFEYTQDCGFDESVRRRKIRYVAIAYELADARSAGFTALRQIVGSQYGMLAADYSPEAEYRFLRRWLADRGAVELHNTDELAVYDLGQGR